MFQRHGISQLADVCDKPSRSKFKSYAIGYVHIDIVEVRTEEGKLHLFVGIDRTSKLVFARLEPKATRMIACQYLRDLIDAFPYRLHTVLTDNGVQFRHPPRYRDGPTARFAGHLFDRICAEHGVEHRLTKPNRPWSDEDRTTVWGTVFPRNGQVERMNRMIKDATVKRYDYASHDELRRHLQLFIDAYNHARRLKTLRGLTPYEFVMQQWTKEPKRFKTDPSNHTPGPNA